MDKLIIAVCVLGIVVVLCDWALRAWDRPGKDTEREESRRRLMEEIRRHTKEGR